MSIEIRTIDGREWTYCICCHQYKGRMKCRHCDRPYRTPKTLANHERICHLNPERKCPTCNGDGVIHIRGDYSELDYEESCLECDMAKTKQVWARAEVPEE